MNDQRHPIGIFDSGYGGLTVFKAIAERMPQYDYIYLGDNARAPYGGRTFDVVHQYTWQCVKWLLGKQCPLVVVACNTASAKALRTIQQKDLPEVAPDRRVLGVIRPTAEVIGNHTRTGHIGVLGTSGTINSGSYLIEIAKFFPWVTVHQQACPMWVPLIENGESDTAAADYFVKKYLDELLSREPRIDTLLLACTHYPLLMDKIVKHLPAGIAVVQQGDIIAHSLEQYFQKHPEIEQRVSRNRHTEYYTTDDTIDFDGHASAFWGGSVTSQHVDLTLPDQAQL